MMGGDRSDSFTEECGLIGVWNHSEASNLAYLALHAQQHRGQEGAGVVSYDSETDRFSAHRALGLVADVFSDFDFGRLPGNRAVGHVRYTTAGGHLLANVQPFYAHVACGDVAVAHNGNLINAGQLREELIQNGAIFSATSDTEVVLHLLAREFKNHIGSTHGTVETVIGAMEKVRGAYSIILLFRDRMIAMRDPSGFRPLVLGEKDGAYFVASETCAFDLFGARTVREIAAGEVLEISGNGHLNSYYPFPVSKESPCIFEYVYFARPDSSVFGRNVYRVRKEMGRQLALEQPIDADIVVPVPDSGVTAAIGYSEQAKIPLELGLIRNHYVGRTFIEPKQSIRDFGVRLKLNANADILNGKRAIIIDDSIVRGTTSRKLVQMLRRAGAKELHLRISSPPTTDPCYYGIDTPEKSELIASHKSIAEIAQYLGVDSLGYLSVDGLYRAVGAARGKFCDACFTGQYPIGTPEKFEKKQQSLL